MSEFTCCIEVACPKCRKRGNQQRKLVQWTCPFCGYVGYYTTFRGWPGSTADTAPPEPVPEPVPELDCQSSSMATCRECEYCQKPNPDGQSFYSYSVMSCAHREIIKDLVPVLRNYSNYGTFGCSNFTPAKAGGKVKTYSEYFKRLEDERRLAAKKLALSELKERFEQDRMKLTWLEEANYRMSQPPGSVTYSAPSSMTSSRSSASSTSKGEPMKIKRFIVRSFLRSFRHSLFILAAWKAAELVHWAWPGLKMAGRMLYPPIYAVARAIHPWLGNASTATSGQQVVAIWIGIIIVAAVAIFLLWRAWLGLNRLARAAFAEEQA